MNEEQRKNGSSFLRYAENFFAKFHFSVINGRIVFGEDYPSRGRKTRDGTRSVY